MTLSSELKKEIKEAGFIKQGDIYKIYLSRTKNSKLPKEERELSKVISEFALKQHNANKGKETTIEE